MSMPYTTTTPVGSQTHRPPIFSLQPLISVAPKRPRRVYVSRVDLYQALVAQCAELSHRPLDSGTLHLPSEMINAATCGLSPSDHTRLQTLASEDLLTCLALNTRYRSVTRSLQMQLVLVQALRSKPGQLGDYRYIYNMILGQVYRSHPASDWYRTSKLVAQRVCKRCADHLVLFRLEVIVDGILRLSAEDCEPRTQCQIQEVQRTIGPVADVLRGLMLGSENASIRQERNRQHEFTGLRQLSHQAIVTVLALLHAVYASSVPMSDTA
jgi:hypothetical protein